MNGNPVVVVVVVVVLVVVVVVVVVSGLLDRKVSEEHLQSSNESI